MKMKGGKKKEKASVKTEEYEVEDIVGHKRERGLDYFKVRWKGFDASDDTWEVEPNLAHAPSFHSKMQALKKETEEREMEREAEMAALSHLKKKRKQPAAGSSSSSSCVNNNNPTPSGGSTAAAEIENDPSRPFAVDDINNADLEYRVYQTGTKVPKTHLPDEVALGSRLRILRFKRLNPLGCTGSSSRDSFIEGNNIGVTYTIDGTDTYTIPFHAARRYCCQRLLSYLIKRTTFRSCKHNEQEHAAAAATTPSAATAAATAAAATAMAAAAAPEAGSNITQQQLQQQQYQQQQQQQRQQQHEQHKQQHVAAGASAALPPPSVDKRQEGAIKEGDTAAAVAAVPAAAAAAAPGAGESISKSEPELSSGSSSGSSGSSNISSSSKELPLIDTTAASASSPPAVFV